jgi:hypothetical protein
VISEMTSAGKWDSVYNDNSHHSGTVVTIHCLTEK